MKNEELIIVDDIMSAVTETEIWNEIQRTDPWITAANKSLNKFLKDNAPAIEDAVEGLVYNMVNAYVQSAILYGIQVSNALHSAFSNPAELGRFTLDKIK